MMVRGRSTLSKLLAQRLRSDGSDGPMNDDGLNEDCHLHLNNTVSDSTAQHERSPLTG